MTRHSQTAPVEETGDVIIRAPRGLSSLLARKLGEHAHRFRSTATLDNRRGGIADARDLYELLLLGLRSGDRVTVRCVGPDARAAFEQVADLLEADGGAA